MKIFYKSFLFITLAVMTAGCTASISYLNDGVSKYTATKADSVKIYSERKIEKGTIELGYVSVHMTNDPNGDVMKETIKKKAAEMGADAVVNFQIMGPLAEGIAVKYK